MDSFGFRDKEQRTYLAGEIREKVIIHIFENAHSKEIFITEINGYKDHLHCLISLGNDQSISKVANLIKGGSSHWINKNGITKIKFEWADEYFAVSVGESQIGAIRNYINNQDEHHRTKSFAEEYDEFMTKYGFKSMV